MSLGLPPADVVEVELQLAEVRRDELAPEDDETLLRYLVYLGAAYVEADRASTYDRLHRLFGVDLSQSAGGPRADQAVGIFQRLRQPRGGFSAPHSP